MGRGKSLKTRNPVPRLSQRTGQDRTGQRKMLSMKKEGRRGVEVTRARGMGVAEKTQRQGVSGSGTCRRTGTGSLRGRGVIGGVRPRLEAARAPWQAGELIRAGGEPGQARVGDGLADDDGLAIDDRRPAGVGTRSCATTAAEWNDGRHCAKPLQSLDKRERDSAADNIYYGKSIDIIG